MQNRRERHQCRPDSRQSQVIGVDNVYITLRVELAACCARLGGSTGQMGRRTGQDRSTAANSTMSGLTAQLRAQNAAFLPRRAAASWKQGEASLR